MSCNVTSPVPALSSAQAAATLPAYKAAAPTMPPLATPYHAPVMRSKAPKYLGLPDQPDRAGMRERRTQSEMTVRALQRQRGVAPAEPAASWPPVSYLNLLSSQISTLPSTGMQALQSVMNWLSVEIGPQGCTAAPVTQPSSALDEFQKKFSTDFEIWLSPSAQRSGEMKDIIIVIGEHHYDPAIQAMVKRVMMGFRQSRGDRFFVESGDTQVCAERVLKYKMSPRDCRLLETDSPVYLQLAKLKDEGVRKLSLCVDYLRAHVPSADEALHAANVLAYSQFIQRHSGQLPWKAIAGFNALMTAANDALTAAEDGIQNRKSERDEQMAAAIRSERSLSARNYVIVGAYHVQGIRERLADLPGVFMVPRQMVAKDPSLRQPEPPREEL